MIGIEAFDGREADFLEDEGTDLGKKGGREGGRNGRSGEFDVVRLLLREGGRVERASNSTRTWRKGTGKRRKFPSLTSKTPTCLGVASPSQREVDTEDPGWEMKNPPASERVGRTRHSCSCLTEGRKGE